MKISNFFVALILFLNVPYIFSTGVNRQVEVENKTGSNLTATITLGYASKEESASENKQISAQSSSASIRPNLAVTQYRCSDSGKQIDLDVNSGEKKLIRTQVCAVSGFSIKGTSGTLNGKTASVLDENLAPNKIIDRFIIEERNGEFYIKALMPSEALGAD